MAAEDLARGVVLTSGPGIVVSDRVLAALRLPVALQGGPVAVSAVFAAMLAMYLTRSDVIAVIVGVGVAALLRAAGFG